MLKHQGVSPSYISHADIYVSGQQRYIWIIQICTQSLPSAALAVLVFLECSKSTSDLKCQRVCCFCQDSGLCTEPPSLPPRPCSSPTPEPAPAPWENRLRDETVDTGHWGGRLEERSLKRHVDMHFNMERENYFITETVLAFGCGFRVSKYFTFEDGLSLRFSGEK